MKAFLLIVLSVPVLLSSSAPWLNENVTDVAMLEGDMVTGNDPHEESRNQCQHCQHAGVPTRSTKIWANQTIPYMISEQFKAMHIVSIMSAIAEIERKTCVTFKPRTTQINYIFFNRMGANGACASNVGKVGKRQYVNLTEACVTHNTVLHELAHVLGFYHEHNRYDRDKYIQVIFENVVPARRNQYQIISHPETLFVEYNIPYDYSSITHYPENSNSANGSKTILRKQSFGIIPPSASLSHYDAIKINLLYNCTDLLPDKENIWQMAGSETKNSTEYLDTTTSSQSMEENSTNIDVNQYQDLVNATKSENVERVLTLLNGGADINERVAKDRNKTAAHFATSNNETQIMLILLNRSASIEAQDDEGLTPLHYASIVGQANIASVLISHGANINARSNNKTTPLHFAAKFGHLNSVSLLLNNSANVEAKDDHGRLAIHLASAYGRINVLSLLLENISSIDATDKYNITPLYQAARNGHTNVVSLLLNNSANVYSQDRDGRMPIHVAADNGHINTVSLMLKNSANIESIDNYNWTPLHFASLKKNITVLSFLLNNSANIEAKDSYASTALHIAAGAGKADVVWYLIKNSANVEAKDNRGRTPLHLAALGGHIGVVSVLLDNSANMSAKDNRGYSSIAYAAKSGHANVVSLILKNYVKKKLKTVDIKPNFFSELFYLAIRYGHTNVVALLVNYRGDLESIDEQGRTPLHIAAVHGQINVAAFLLNKSANTEAKEKYGKTPLHLAAGGGNMNIASLLINNSANVEAIDNHDWTPLHHAAQNGHVNVASVLLSNSANITSNDRIGRTPLHIASSFGHPSVVSFLLNKSADIESKDNNAWTPLHHASYQGQNSTVLLLLEYGANIFAKTAGSLLTALDLAKERNEVHVKRILEQQSSLLLAAAQHSQHAGMPTRSTKLWDNRMIPYKISPRFKLKDTVSIRSAMAEIEDKTCVTFAERTTHKNYIYFNRMGANGACASNVGKVGKRQYVNLTEACVTHNTVLHELAHVLGFDHENNRYDRDKHIQVIWENVIPERRNWYQIIRQPVTLFVEHNIPYDYSSITHFPEYSNSVNGEKTILSKQPYGIISPSAGLSHYDVIKINLLYNCTDLIPDREYVLQILI